MLHTCMQLTSCGAMYKVIILITRTKQQSTITAGPMQAGTSGEYKVFIFTWYFVTIIYCIAYNLDVQ